MAETADGGQAAQPRARTMRWQGTANRMVRGLLATPLVARGIGARLVTLHVVGRKSGRRMSVPVAYTRHDGGLLIGTPFAWGRNLRSGETIEVRYRGRLRRAAVQVFTDEAEVVDRYAVIARGNRNFASFNGIGLDADGEPDRGDLHQAWAAGARVFQLTLLEA